MTPQIALDLSLDTISVLSRAPGGGWWREGTVRLSDVDMPERLSALRDAAERRAGPDFVSVLVLPDSQLLYTSLERDDRRPDETIRSMLKGRTPYDVADLTWDYVERGDRLQVAVVALDTLMEAESFAAEYGFRPVAVTANPTDPAYPGIPSFGKTGLAGDLLGGAALDLALEDGFRAIPAPPLPEAAAVEPEAPADPPVAEEPADRAAAAETADEGPEPDMPTFRHATPVVEAPAAAVFSSPRKAAAGTVAPGFVSARTASAQTAPEARTARGERLSRIAPRLTATPALGTGRDAPPLPTPADIEATGSRGTRYPVPPADPPMTAPPIRFDAPKKSVEPVETPDAPPPGALAPEEPPRSFDAPKRKKPVPTIEDTPGRTRLKPPPVAPAAPPPGSFAEHLKRRAADPDAVAEWKAVNDRRATEGAEAAKVPATELPKRYDVAPEDAPASLAARIKRRAAAERAEAEPDAIEAPPPVPASVVQAAKPSGGARLGLMLTLSLLAVLAMVGLGATVLGGDAETADEGARLPAAAAALVPAAPADAAPREVAALRPADDQDASADALLPEPGSVTTGSANPSVIAAPTPIDSPLLARSLPEGTPSEEQIQASVAPDLASPPSFETAPVAETTPAIFIGIWKAEGDFAAPNRLAPPTVPAPPVVVAALDPALAGLALPGLPEVVDAPQPLSARLDPPPAELAWSRDAALGLTPATEEWTVMPAGYALLRGRPEALPRPRPGGDAEARLAALPATPAEPQEAAEEVAPLLAALPAVPAETTPEAARPAETAPEPIASLAAAALDRVASPPEAQVALVAATAEGTLAPGGYTVLQGRPSTLPLRRPGTEAGSSETTEVQGRLTPTAEGVQTPEGYTLRLGRPDIMPSPRPGDDVGDATGETSAAPIEPSPEPGLEAVAVAPTEREAPDATEPVDLAALDPAEAPVPNSEGVTTPGGDAVQVGRSDIVPELPAVETSAEAELPGEEVAALTPPDVEIADDPSQAILRRYRPVERPDIVDEAVAARAAALAAEAEAAEAALAEMRRIQPRQRPSAIAERAAAAEVAIAAARAATEQAAIDAAQQAAAASLASAATASGATATPGPVSVLALAESERPRTRPGRVEREAARIVNQRRQVASAASAATAQPSQPAATQADRGTQQIRSAGGNVARAATERNVLRLNQTNLIGVYGRANARRALVRLSNGRYVKVEVGDRLDRGRVTAIGEDRLQYQRGSRNVVLRLPRG